jgi:hypothetical protein
MGEPPPRGGERREPNPLFLAHAAGLSELYVVLKTGVPENIELAGFEREAEARETFFAAADREIDSSRMLVACVGLARDLRRCITAPEWLVGEGEQRVDLLGILRAARRPHDEAREREEAKEREEEAERERLRSDPEALAERLRDELRYAWGDEQLGRAATDALRLSVQGEGGLNEIERAALKAVGGMLAEPLSARLAEGGPTPSEREALAALVAHHRASQIERLDEMAGRFGEGPKVRQRRRCLADGDLLGADSLARLAHDAEQDREAAAQQDRLREDYLRWREGEAKRLAKLQGFIARRRTGRDAFLAEVDRGALRLCSDCGEIAYPDPEREPRPGGQRHVGGRCHFCGAGALSELPSEGVEPT